MFNFKFYGSSVILILRYYYNQTVNVFSHVTIRLAVDDFLWVVHCEHGSILHRCGPVDELANSLNDKLNLCEPRRAIK